MPFRINLGGEAEVLGVLNQQGRWIVLMSGWRSSQTGQTFEDLVRAGHDFLIADNTALPLPDDVVDEVITNNIPPVDSVTWLGPTVQSSEVRRILKSGGRWILQWHRSVHQAMTAFFDLFVRHSSDPSVRDDPTWADRRFPELVASSPFHLWRPGDPVPERGDRYLIGVATWSGYDMRLLDVIAEALRRNRVDPPAIDVFNTAECRQQQDFDRYISGIGTVLQTPVVGYWNNGHLADSEQAYAALDFLAGVFGFCSAEIVAFVQDWIKAQAHA